MPATQARIKTLKNLRKKRDKKLILCSCHDGGIFSFTQKILKLYNHESLEAISLAFKAINDPRYRTNVPINFGAITAQ